MSGHMGLDSNRSQPDTPLSCILHSDFVVPIARPAIFGNESSY